MNFKGIIFDYGGTIDTNGKHWGEVLWKAYADQYIPVAKEAFRNAYIYGEHYLATHPVIHPQDNFRTVLEAKIGLQIQWLIAQGLLKNDITSSTYSLAVSDQCYNFVVRTLKNVIPVLEKLSSKYPLVLVTNFYGNIRSVLKDFGLDLFFKEMIESAVVKVRKPDPAIFALGINALELRPEETLVIGDSYTKDIQPAQTLGCQTIWLNKRQTWEEDSPESAADAMIFDFKELEKRLL